MVSTTHRIVRPLLIAASSIAVAMLLAQLLPFLQQRGISFLLLGAVSLSACFGGSKSAWTAIGLSALVMAWMLTPVHSMWIETSEDVVRLGLFVIVGIGVSSLYLQRDHALEQLKLSEQRLALALESANMGAWEADLKNGEFTWTPGMERIFGRLSPDSDARHNGFLGYIQPDDKDFLDRAAFTPFPGGRAFEIEHRVTRQDGETRWVITRGRILSPDGTPERMIAVASDVTDQRLRQNKAVASLVESANRT